MWVLRQPEVLLGAFSVLKEGAARSAARQRVHPIGKGPDPNQGSRGLPRGKSVWAGKNPAASACVSVPYSFPQQLLSSNSHSLIRLALSCLQQ